MGDSATLTEQELAEIERERATAREDEAPVRTPPSVAVAKSAATPIVPEVVQDEPVPAKSIAFKSKFGVLERFQLYDIGRAILSRRHHQRWQESLALGLLVGGVFYAEVDASPALVSVFWRTDNPNVDLRHELPMHAPDGNFVYICWLWTTLGASGITALRRHIEAVASGAKFIAHHDQRSKGKRPARSEREKMRGTSRLIVTNLTTTPLALRNGVARGI